MQKVHVGCGMIDDRRPEPGFWDEHLAEKRERLTNEFARAAADVGRQVTDWASLTALAALVLFGSAILASDGSPLMILGGGASALSLGFLMSREAVNMVRLRQNRAAEIAGLLLVQPSSEWKDNEHRSRAEHSRNKAKALPRRGSPSGKLVFAWTPLNSQDGLGSIALREAPHAPLTIARYRGALAARIDRLVQAEEPEVARALLRIVEAREGLIANTGIRSVGMFMVENSGWLREKVGMPDQAVPLAKLVHEPYTLERLTDGEDTLESFLSLVYSTDD